MNLYHPTRRELLAATSATWIAHGFLGQGRAVLDAAEPESPREMEPAWIRKTVKAGMIKLPDATKNGDWEVKLRTAKDAGFEGVEPNTGKLDVAGFRAAADKVDIEIDGTVGGYHWRITHTSPDQKVREQAQQLLEESLQQTHDLGATTFLIVPGHGKDGTPEVVRQRAFDAIAAAIPMADRLGVHILIENVWNHFLYDHGGDENQSAAPLADFVDSFGTDTVGVQFDLGNHWKYGDVAEWVETLGDRIQKLDIKGFSRQSNQFTDITEGDIDWWSVKSSLAKIRYTGWLAAEVGGGDQARLTKVADQMESALDCQQTLAQVLRSQTVEASS